MDPDLFYLTSSFSPTILSTILSPSTTPSHSHQLHQKEINSPIPPFSLQPPTTFLFLLFLAQITQYYKQSSSNRFQCALCPKQMISQTTIIKHIMNQHKPQVDELRLRLLHNIIFYRYLNDPSALSLSPQMQSLPVRAYIIKNFNPHKDHSGKFKIFDPKYRVLEINTYKRNAHITDAIDTAWTEAIAKVKSQISKYHKTKQELFNKNVEMSDLVDMIGAGGDEEKANIEEEQTGGTGMVERDLDLEAKAELLKKKRKVLQLFKGLDGDGLGRGKALPSQLNYDNDDPSTVTMSDSTATKSNQTTASQIGKITIDLTKHRLYGQIQDFIDAHDNQEIIHNSKVYVDVADAYNFDYPFSYGLDPFVGQ